MVVAVLFNMVGMAPAAMGLVTPPLAITVVDLSIFAILPNTLHILRLKFQREALVESAAGRTIPEGVMRGAETTLLLEGVRLARPHL